LVFVFVFDAIIVNAAGMMHKLCA